MLPLYYRWFGKKLYSSKSAKSTGTLYAARNTVNARNVSNEPSDNLYASTELLNTFDSAYIACGGVHHFGMASLESAPTRNVYEGDIGNKQQMSQFVLRNARSFVDTYVDIQVPELPKYGPPNNNMRCRHCNKVFKTSRSFRKHESVVHGQYDPQFSDIRDDPTPAVHEGTDGNDWIMNYTRICLLLGH